MPNGIYPTNANHVYPIKYQNTPIIIDIIVIIPNFSILVRNSIKGIPVIIGMSKYMAGYKIGIAFIIPTTKNITK